MGSSSGPWGQSKLDIIPDNIIGSSNGLNYKCVETNFEGAVETCAANNARLCTPKEISDRCTRGTGCNFNSRLVWTCIAGKTHALVTPNAAVERAVLTGHVRKNDCAVLLISRMDVVLLMT